MLREASHSEKASQTARDAAQRTGQKVKEQTQSITHWLTDQAESRGQEQKGWLAEQAHGVAESMRTSKEGLKDEQRQAVGQYLDAAADRIDGFADYLRNHDVADLRRQTEDTVRQHPGLFLGTMFVGGLALGRFLSSGQTTGSEQGPQAQQGQQEPGSQSDESVQAAAQSQTGREYEPTVGPAPDRPLAPGAESAAPQTPPPTTHERSDFPYRRPEAPTNPPESGAGEPERFTEQRMPAEEPESEQGPSEPNKPEHERKEDRP
ncbi:MAG: hypothetical protein ACODAQ_12080 [Phycisphaeraceae bacterium]